MAKSVEVTITNGAVAVLKKMLPDPLWYEGKGKAIVMGGIDANEHLAEVKVEEGNNEWSKEECKLQLPLIEFNAIKACAEWFLKNGRLGLTVHVKSLITEFDLEF